MHILPRQNKSILCTKVLKIAMIKTVRQHLLTLEQSILSFQCNFSPALKLEIYFVLF